MSLDKFAPTQRKCGQIIATIEAVIYERTKMEENKEVQTPSSAEGNEQKVVDTDTASVNETQSTQNADSKDAKVGEGIEDSSNGEKVKTEPKKEEQKQSREKDSEYAKLRHERAVQKAKQEGDMEGYKRARIKSVGGKNPYSDNAPIDTEEDYEFYELQDEAHNRGIDEKNPYELEKLKRTLAKEKEEERQKLLTEEERQNEFVINDTNAYLSKYGEEGSASRNKAKQKLNAYLNNKAFQEFADDLMGKVSIETIINRFDKYHSRSAEEIKETQKVERQMQKSYASPGGAENGTTLGQQSHKPFSKMTNQEFKSYLEGVKSGRYKIGE